jgi:hypothetical protein
MDPYVLNEISRRIRGIDVRPLTGGISRYIRLSGDLAESLRNPDLNGRRAARQLETCCGKLFEEAPALLEMIADIRKRIVDLQYEENGNGNEPPDEGGRQCFGILKRHGMELLAHLTDEIGIVQETLRQGEQVHTIVSRHVDPMKRAARLLDILLERFARRPTVAYRVGGDTEDIRRLTYAVAGMETWASASQGADDASPAEALRAATLSPYGHVVQATWEELAQRSRKITKAAAELKEGWGILHRLSAKGCSRKIRQQAERLSFQHEARRRAFQKFIRESRAAAPRHRRAGRS